MATDDRNKRRKPATPTLSQVVNPLISLGANVTGVSRGVSPTAISQPIRAGLRDVLNEYERAGGGARGAGAGTRAALGQAINIPAVIGSSVAGTAVDTARQVTSPFVEFGAGLAGIEPGPSTPAPAPAAVPTGPVPEFRLPPGILPAPPSPPSLQIQRPAGATTSTPVTPGVPPRTLTPDGPPVFRTGGPRGGTAQFAGGAVQRVANDYGAGRTNIVPSYPLRDGPAAAASPAARAAQAPGRAESAALARSRELDGMLRALVQQAQQEPQSYGELFARKGTLNALREIAGVAQGAGSNYVQSAGDVIQADTSRYGTDRAFESDLGRQAVQREGNQLQFESSLGAQNVTAEGNLLRALLDRENQTVARETSERQAEATRAAAAARAAATERAAQIRAEASRARAISANPLSALELAIQKRVKLDGTPASEADIVAMKQELRELQELRAVGRTSAILPLVQ